MNLDVAKRYAELKRQQRLIDNELEFLKEETLATVLELAGDEKLPVDIPGVGSFTVAEYKRWQFSESVANLETQLTEIKAQEKALGVATFTSEPQLRFNVIE